MRLIIVESPAKCSKIQGFLGPGNQVIASMGHIRALVQDIDSVGINRNFEPTYEFMKEKSKAIAQLKATAKGATSIILCSDDDREGEAIAYSIALLLKLNVATNPRAAFREITKNAVLDAVSNPRTIDMSRVQSQQARAMLDMMVGFTISPLLWKHVARGSEGAALSAGRCQTPALRLVCEREDIIEKFKSESSWLVTGTWSAGSGSPWPATMTEPLSDEESAMNYLENHSTEPSGKIRSAITKPWLESAPQALMTSTLQQQASNLYHCAPKRTMQIAQKLYEAGHITYMRTDQTTMSDEAVDQAKRVIESKWGKTYIGARLEKPKSTKKNDTVPAAQEAHEAIRPTHFENSNLPAEEDWGVQDRKLYRLIWLRAIQSIMTPATGEAREIIFDANGDDNSLPWEAKWKRTVFPGWKAADEKDFSSTVAQNGDDSDVGAAIAAEAAVSNEAFWKLAEGLKPGQEIKWRTLKAQPQETKPQGRYTEATLVRELEKKGIGRPSTFASLIATIIEKAYVEVQDITAKTQESKMYTLTTLGQWPPISDKFILKQGGEKSRMVPTPLGRTVMAFALKHFPDLFAFQFTATMESRLDKVAEGSENWRLVLADTWNSYKDRFNELKTSGSAGTSGSNPKRREFSDGIIAVISAKGPLLLKEGATKEETVFYGWPGNKGFSDLTDEEAKAFVASVVSQKQGDTLGEWNGHQVIKKKGPYGFYAEWNGVKVNLAEGDALEAIIVKIQGKQENPTRTIGPFQVKTGPYGPYLMKAGSGKGKPQYVSIPKGTDIEGLTAQQAGEIFEAGLKAKVTASKRKFKQKN
jgi:DNA topoisomerase-1